MEALAFFGPKQGSQISLLFRTNLFPLGKLNKSHLNSFPDKPAKIVGIKATTTNDQESNRKFKKLPPSNWGHYFLYARVDVSEMDMLAREIDILRPKARDMLISTKDVDATKKRILLIYLLVSLGVAYHFEDEIDKSLREAFESIEQMIFNEDDDLYTTSIIFWVFRTYGYNMSSEVFKRFTENGKFKESLTEDVKGMISLYEASYLKTTTDDILNEALSFTTSNLESLYASGACQPHIYERIRNAFRMPQHYNAEMLFAYEYISSYEEEEGHDKMLLRFSKISFKFMQLTWIQELKVLTKWWKEQDLASKLPPYFRDRMVEGYVISFMIYFEPQFSVVRSTNTKLTALLTLIDDTCDRYGSLPEVAALVHCLERWDPDYMDGLPDYMKTVFKFVLNVFEECENAGKSEEGLSYNVHGAMEEFKIYLRANLRFTEWAQTDMVPTFDEYLEIGGIEVTMYVAIAFSFLGLGKTSREKGYEWLKSRPKFIQAQAKKGRLMNDMTGFEDDMSRGYAANAINYYMKQYKVNEEETFVGLDKMVGDLDKTINEELLTITTNKVPREILKRAIDFGKMIDFMYRSGESYTHPEGTMKENIASVFVNLIRL